ncbi:MAG: cupin domain-containing protein [Pseudomonadota bacterium]
MVDLMTHAPEQGEANSAFNLRRWFRITPEQSDGRMAVFEEEIPAGSGPPLHVHTVEHELFVVLSGRVLFHRDGHEVEGGPGSSILIPPGAVHAFKGIETSRVLVTLTPGQGINFFRAVEAEGLSPANDMPRIIELGAEHDIEFKGPPL